MTTAKMGSVFAAALMFLIGNASAETPGLMVASTGKSASESPAPVHSADRRDGLASSARLVTAGQTDAASSQGRPQRQASAPQRLSDGGEWILPARLLIQLEDVE